MILIRQKTSPHDFWFHILLLRLLFLGRWMLFLRIAGLAARNIKNNKGKEEKILF
jgi:hypothetical protein